MLLVIIAMLAIALVLFAFVKWTFGAGAVELDEPTTIHFPEQVRSLPPHRAMAIPRKHPVRKTRRARSL